MRSERESSGARPRAEGWEWVPAPMIVVAALGLWEVLARAGVLAAVFFPAPTVIAATLWRLAASGDLAASVAATLRRLALGFALGAAPALVLGLAMGRSRRLRGAVDPLVATTHPIPKIAVLPIIMIIFGIGETSKTVVVALGAFFPVLINAMTGVRQISPIHFEVAKNYGAGAWSLFVRVLLPGSLPLVLAGVRLGVNIALLLTIAVEMVVPERGLGAMIWMAWETLRTEDMYASLVVIAALGVGFNAALQFLARRLVPWQADGEG